MLNHSDLMLLMDLSPMPSLVSPTFLCVPGLRDHVDDHWQTHFACKRPGVRTVPFLEHDKLSCAARVQALDDTLAQIKGPVVLVAHSAGVLTTVHWAHSKNNRHIQGALLVTPPDFDTPLPQGYPSQELLDQNGWRPVPMAPLPFPSLIAATTNDPLASFDRVREMAVLWGSRLVNVGALGHINPASGFGEWPMAEELVMQLC